MKKLILILTLFLVYACSIGAVAAASNDTADNIISSSDSNDCLIDNNENTFYDLSKLVDDAPDTLELDKDYINSEYGGQITISKEMTIDGKGHTLDADGVSRIFDIESSNVKIKNIIFVNGNCLNNVTGDSKGYIAHTREDGSEYYDSYDEYSSGGGAIQFKVGVENCAIINCTFINCRADDGGAVYAMDCDSLRIQNCIFRNCFADVKNYPGGGAIDLMYTPNSKITGSRFINCSTGPESCDDSVSLYYSPNTLIKNCEFVDSSDKEHGGTSLGIFRSHNSTVSKCKFINLTGGSPSAIDIFVSNGCTVKNCAFIDCENEGEGTVDISVSNNTKVINSRFVNCYSGYRGGAIEMNDGDESENCSVINCSFEKCSSGEGGAIYSEHYSNLIKNCRFKGCSAEKGGAVYLKAGRIEDSVFENNRDAFEGAIYNVDGKIKNCTFKGDNIYNNTPKVKNTTEVPKTDLKSNINKHKTQMQHSISENTFGILKSVEKDSNSQNITGSSDSGSKKNISSDVKKSIDTSESINPAVILLAAIILIPATIFVFKK